MTVNHTAAYKIREMSWLAPVFLFTVAVLSRLPFRSNFLYHLDSVHYALGLKQYDIYLHQPHPPGYFLYVMAGKAVNLFFQDPNLSFTWISVIASGFAVVAIYYLGSAIFSRVVGFSAALLGLTSPLSWFYGEVALNYAVAAFLNTWVALLCWQLVQKEYKWVYLSPVILGCVAGIRQDFFIFLFPLWLVCVFRSLDLKKVLILLSILGTTIALWFMPMLVMTGGLERYQAALREYWQFHTSAFTIWNAGLGSRKDVALTLMGSLSYGLGIGAVFILFSLYAMIRTGRWRFLSGDKGIFFGLWLIPALLFYAFVFLQPYLHRYGLFFLPGLVILLPGSIEYTLAEINRAAGRRYLPSHLTQSMVLSLIIGLNGVVFCFSKTAYSARTIQEHDRNLEVILSGIKDNFQSGKTVIVDAKSSYFYSYRHIQYYLPEFPAYQADYRVNGRGQKWHIFGAVDGQTRLYDAVRIPEGTSFIVYLFDPRDEAFAAELKAQNVRQILLQDQLVLWYQQVNVGKR